MSRLAAAAEIDKLAHALGLRAGELAFLREIPAEELRAFRTAVYEHLFELDEILFRRLASLARRLPTWLVAFLGRWVFGPVVTARIAGEFSAQRGVAIARKLPTSFLADVCVHVDPRCARDLVRLFPLDRILEVALELVARRDYLTMGRLVDYLTDDAVHAVDEALADEEVLLRIGYYVESRNRLDHLVRLMPRDRVRRAILLVLDESKNVLPETASLLLSVSYGLKRELGDLAAQQDESVLDRVVLFAHEEKLFHEILPAFAVVSESSQRKIVNLPILRREPAVVASVLEAADAHDLWSVALPLVHLMQDDMRQVVAGIAAKLPRVAMERAAAAALTGEQWEALLDVIARMPAAKQREFADIVTGYADVDPELVVRIRGRAGAFGFGDAFSPAAIPAAG